MKFLINPWFIKNGVTSVSLLHSYVTIIEEEGKFVLTFHKGDETHDFVFDSIEDARDFTINVISQSEDIDVIESSYEEYYNQKKLELN